MQAHSSPSPELRYKQLPSDLLNLQTQLRVTTEAHAKRNGRLIKRTMSGVNPQIAYRTSPSRPQTAPGHLKGRKRRSTPLASPVKVQYFKANRRKTTPRGGGAMLTKMKRSDDNPFLQHELSIKASMLSHTLKINHTNRSKSPRRDMLVRSAPSPRISSHTAKLEYLFAQYLGATDGHMDQFATQWMTEQIGLSSDNVDNMIEEAIESSIILGNIRSKATTRLACCVCLIGLEKLGAALPSHKKFLRTSRDVFASSIFEGSFSDSDSDDVEFTVKHISKKQMYKDVNDQLWNENERLKEELRALKAKENESPGACVVDTLSDMTEAQQSVVLSKIATKFPKVYTSSLTRSAGQKQLEEMHHQVWNAMAPSTQQTGLAFLLSRDTEVSGKVLATVPSILYKTMLVKNAELLTNFLWSHLNIVCKTILRDDNLSRRFLIKNGEELVAYGLSRDVASTPGFWTGDNWMKIVLDFASRVLVQSPNVATPVFVKHSNVLGSIFERHPNLLVEVIKTQPHLLRNLFDDGRELVVSNLPKVPEIIDAIISNEEVLIQTLSERSDSKFIFSVMDGMPDKVVEYFQEKPQRLAHLLIARPKLLSGAEAASPGMFAHVASFDSQFIVQNQPLLRMLGLYGLPLSKEIGTQTAPSLPGISSLLAGQYEPKPLVAITKAMSAEQKLLVKNYVHRTSASGGVKCWPDSQLNSTILDLYAGKIKANRVDHTMGHPQDTMTDFILDFFSHNGKSAKVGMKKVRELVATIQRMDPLLLTRRVFWFGVVTGVIVDDKYPFYPDAVEVLLTFLLELFNQHENDIVSRLSDHNLKCSVDVERANRAAQRIFGDPPASVEDLEKVLDKLKRASKTEDQLPSSARVDLSLRTPNAVGKYVDVDSTMDFLMDRWYVIQLAEREKLVDSFVKADVNGDSSLDFKEFLAVVKKLIPCADQRTVLRLFRSCGTQNANGEVALTAEHFSSVMKHFLRSYRTILLAQQ